MPSRAPSEPVLFAHSEARRLRRGGAQKSVRPNTATPGSASSSAHSTSIVSLPSSSSAPARPRWGLNAARVCPSIASSAQHALPSSAPRVRASRRLSASSQQLPRTCWLSAATFPSADSTSVLPSRGSAMAQPAADPRVPSSFRSFPIPGSVPVLDTPPVTGSRAAGTASGAARSAVGVPECRVRWDFAVQVEVRPGLDCVFGKEVVTAADITAVDSDEERVVRYQIRREHRRLEPAPESPSVVDHGAVSVLGVGEDDDVEGP
eukprot:2014261-Rhodomonas_salina.2